MNSLFRWLGRRGRWAGVLAAGVFLPLAGGMSCGVALAAAPATGTGPISLAQYRGQLVLLDALVAECAKAVGTSHCDSERVGPDIQVALATGPRSVRFGWLRDLLEAAAKPDAAKPESAKAGEKKAAGGDSDAEEDSDAPAQPAPADKPDVPGTKDKSGKKEPDQPSGDEAPLVPNPVVPAHKLTIFERLDEARDRLERDLDRADELAGGGSTGKAPQASGDGAGVTPARLAAEHATLVGILQAREYKPSVHQRTLRDRLFEKLNGWINTVVDKLTRVGAKSKWIGPTAEISFVVVLCIGLVWFLIRLERRGRFQASSLRPVPGMGAASARDWQLWLQDARTAAAAGAWRDAIHLLYWASISRLESSGQWPADRARTPREYLALLGQESQQRPVLMALTRSFERTWYAGRVAGEADFLQAEQLAGKLGAR